MRKVWEVSFTIHVAAAIMLATVSVQPIPPMTALVVADLSMAKTIDCDPKHEFSCVLVGTEPLTDLNRLVPVGKLRTSQLDQERRWQSGKQHLVRVYSRVETGGGGCRRSSPAIVEVGDSVRFEILIENKAHELRSVTIAVPSDPAMLPIEASEGVKFEGNSLAWKVPLMKSGDILERTVIYRCISSQPGQRYATLQVMASSEFHDQSTSCPNRYGSMLNSIQRFEVTQAK